MASRPASAEPPPEAVAQLERTWRAATGFPGALAEVNNQPLGKRVMLTAFIFFLLGGVLALLMRVQLSVSEFDFLGPQEYNQFFTMHGSTMMFLFVVPFLEGLAIYLLPMMIGSRDVAFPRMTAFGYWVYLFGGLIFYASFLFGTVPDAGWFAYTPLSGSRYTGMGSDFWLLGLSLVEVAGLTAAVEIVVTILKQRAPGMTLGRMPLLVWAMLVAALMIIFAFTVLLVASALLELDRSLETRFFDPDYGGNSLLWQHLFWFFGHPEVYIMFLPATGIISMIVPVFARRPVVGYLLIVVAIVVTGFVSFGLWVHHMFTAGLPELSKSFFTASSLMIALASGTQVFAWIATLWGSRPALRPPLLFALGFLFIFVLGGMTGVMVAVVPFDMQVHDTFFVVAHFHYVLIGGVIFPIFAGLHYWLPKITGRMLSPALGVWSFAIVFVGFNLTFFPMHVMGFLGLPRRVYTYSSALELDAYNLAATCGAFLMALGVLVFVVNLARSVLRGPQGGENPWGSDSLEWSIASPPPIFTFFTTPVVRSRHPLWKPAAEQSDIDGPLRELTAALAGEPQQWRGTLITDALDARPQAIQWLPGPTYVPLWAALGVTAAAVGVLSRAYIVALFGCVVAVVALVNWLRPRDKVLRMLRASDLPERTGLPVLKTGTLAPAWWGTVGLLATVGTAFAALFYAYFYIRLFSDAWPQGEIARPALGLPLVALVFLVASAGARYWAGRAFQRGDRRATHLGLGATMLAGILFLAIGSVHLWLLDFTPKTNAYASLFYVISWLLDLVVTVGLVVLALVQIRVGREHEDREGFMGLQMEIGGLLWYFAVVVGLLVFALLYLSPHLL